MSRQKGQRNFQIEVDRVYRPDPERILTALRLLAQEGRRMRAADVPETKKEAAHAA